MNPVYVRMKFVKQFMALSDLMFVYACSNLVGLACIGFDKMSYFSQETT